MQHHAGDELIMSREGKWLTSRNDRSESRVDSTTLPTIALTQWEDSREVSCIL